MTARVIRLCQARTLATAVGTGTASHPCTNRARWWVAFLDNHARMTDPRALCGVHARGARFRWPLLTDDPAADRAALEETFR